MSLVSLALALALGQAPTTVAAATTQPNVKPTPAIDPVILVTSTVDRIREVSRLVQGKVQEARDTKDMVKLNCVNEKLTQISALLRISEQADPLLRDALVSRDHTAITHEVSKVNLAGQKVDLLRGEVDECIGQLAFATDENLMVEVVEPDNLYPGDPTRPGTPGTPEGRLPPAQGPEVIEEPIERPPPISPVE